MWAGAPAPAFIGLCIYFAGAGTPAHSTVSVAAAFRLRQGTTPGQGGRRRRTCRGGITAAVPTMGSARRPVSQSSGGKVTAAFFQGLEKIDSLISKASESCSWAERGPVVAGLWSSKRQAFYHGCGRHAVAPCVPSGRFRSGGTPAAVAGAPGTGLALAARVRPWCVLWLYRRQECRRSEAAKPATQLRCSETGTRNVRGVDSRHGAPTLTLP